jgi:hypothetical protein
MDSLLRGLLWWKLGRDGDTALFWYVQKLIGDVEKSR